MSQDKAHPTPSDYCRMDDGRCGICGGDWSVCGCQGMLDRRSLAAPVASNTTAEPSPIQPAGVEVERDELRNGYLSPDYCKGFADGQATLRPGECDALLKLPRFNYGYVEDEWGMNRALGFIADSQGPAVRFADVVAAIRAAASQGDRGKT